MSDNNIVSFTKARDKIYDKEINEDMIEFEIMLDHIITDKMVCDIGNFIGYNLSVIAGDPKSDNVDIVAGFSRSGDMYIEYNPIVDGEQLMEIIKEMILSYDYNNSRDVDNKHYANCVCDEDGAPSKEHGYFAPTIEEAVILAAWSLISSPEDISNV